MIKCKRGSLEIISLTIIVIILFIILSAVYILYTQINNMIYPIKQDLFYMVQNAYFSLNKEKLAYYSYEIDELILKSKIEELIKCNYPNYSIKIINVNYNYKTNSVDIELNMVFTPILLSNVIGDCNITIKDSIKLKMMEVK